MMYVVKTPWLLKLLYSHCVWKLPSKEKIIYLTFDDGPHPQITPFVLDTLKKYDAKATFFCIGKNVATNPDCYRSILEQGHRTGNHTNNHLNGWKVKDEEYVNDVLAASKYIDSNLFRPPYGKISRFQVKTLREKKNNPFNIIMWDVLSGDFDKTIDAEKCATHVIVHASKGSIVVFHDSEKAFPRLEFALPKVLEFFSKKGFRFEALRM